MALAAVLSAVALVVAVPLAVVLTAALAAAPPSAVVRTAALVAEVPSVVDHMVVLTVVDTVAVVAEWVDADKSEHQFPDFHIHHPRNLAH